MIGNDNTLSSKIREKYKYNGKGKYLKKIIRLVILYLLEMRLFYFPIAKNNVYKSVINSFFVRKNMVKYIEVKKRV